MRSPLLEVTEGSNSKLHCIFWTILIVFAGVFHLLINKKTEFQLGTRSLNTKELLDAYFEMGSLPKIMQNGDPFRGNVNPRIDLSKCDNQTPTCKTICLGRIKPSPSSSRDLKFSQPVSCTRTNTDREQECWDTSKMRCWNVNGGVQVFDGKLEWELIKHFQPKSFGLASWVHLRSFDMRTDFFVFGWGSVRPISEICNAFDSSEVPSQIQMVPPGNTIILSGHSEGSGWALCGNEFIHENSILNPRRVITSGSLIADSTFMSAFDQQKILNSVFLLAAAPLPGTTRILSDILALSRSLEGVTFPQFGYACDGVTRSPHDQSPFRSRQGSPFGNCIIPQPVINIAESAGMINSLDIIQQQFLQDLHTFANYRKCYKACSDYFDRMGVTFSPNVQPFIKVAGMPRLSVSVESTSPLLLPQPASEASSTLGEIPIRPPPIRESPSIPREFSIPAPMQPRVASPPRGEARAFRAHPAQWRRPTVTQEEIQALTHAFEDLPV